MARCTAVGALTSPCSRGRAGGVTIDDVPGADARSLVDVARLRFRTADDCTCRRRFGDGSRDWLPSPAARGGVDNAHADAGGMQMQRNDDVGVGGCSSSSCCSCFLASTRVAPPIGAVAGASRFRGRCRKKWKFYTCESRHQSRGPVPVAGRLRLYNRTCVFFRPCLWTTSRVQWTPCATSRLN